MKHSFLDQTSSTEYRLKMDPKVNFIKLRSDRRELQPGDLFYMQLINEKFLFGRVVKVKPPRDQAPMPESNLIYIYDSIMDSRQPEPNRLKPNHLLLPPIWTNRLGWTKGYFQFIENLPLTAGDLLDRHCFRNHQGKFINEIGAPLPNEIEPCGTWGLVSYRWIDDHVSDVLGFPRVF